MRDQAFVADDRPTTDDLRRSWNGFGRPLRACLGGLVLAVFAPIACGPNPITPEDLTIEDVVEALFLGTGRANAEGGCPEDPGGPHLEGVWRTFARGSGVQLVIGSSVAPEGREALAREIEVVNGLTSGFLTISLLESSDPDPLPNPGQITSADFPAGEVATICDGNRQGCAIPNALGSTYQSVRTVQGLQFPGTAHVHEVGHALGLCHINGQSLPTAVMANPQLAAAERFVDLEREAIQRVFASGLEPGATHAEFREAGLIR